MPLEWRKKKGFGDWGVNMDASKILDYIASKFPFSSLVFKEGSWEWDTDFQWDEPPSGTYSPKGTNEVADANNQNGNLHGGNNTSFEVDNSISNTPQGGKNSEPQGGDASGDGNGKSPSGSSGYMPEGLEGGVPSDATNLGDNAQLRENLSGYPLSPTQRGEGRKASSSQSVNAGEQVAPKEVLTELGGIQNNPPSKNGDLDVTQQSEGGSLRCGHADKSNGFCSGSSLKELDHPHNTGDDVGDAWLSSQETYPDGNPLDVIEGLPEVDTSGNETQLFAEVAERQSASPKGRKGRRSTTAFYALRNGVTVPRKIINRVRRSLEEWLADLGDQETMGRRDYEELAWRSKTLSGLGRALKVEIAHPALLVMCDVSGSCLGFAEDALHVAQAIAEIGMGEKDIIIVTHTNGIPYEVSINGSEPKSVDGNYSYNDVSYYIKLLKKHSITHVLALGDGDAFYHYQALASSSQVESLLWLDNYACSYTAPKREHRSNNHPKIRYVIGCKSADDFADAIRIAVKGMRK